MAKAGDFLLLCYDVPGVDLWHERLVTAISPHTAGLFAVVTPDLDHYGEECILTNEDLRGIRHLARQGDTPPGILAANVYRFAEVPTRAEQQRLFRDEALLVGAPPPAGTGSGGGSPAAWA